MSVTAAFDSSQLASLKRAIARSPQAVKDETRLFLTRGMAAYKGFIIRNPWRMSGSGGGAPVAAAHGGNLRDTHRTSIGQWSAIIKPTAKYAPYVHEGTFRMKARPWLDYAQQQADGQISILSNQLLDNITKDLAD